MSASTITKLAVAAAAIAIFSRFSGVFSTQSTPKEEPVNPESQTSSDDCAFDADEPKTSSSRCSSLQSTPRKSQSSFNLAFAKSSAEYAEVYDRIDTENDGYIPKTLLIDVLKEIPALTSLASAAEDPIALAISQIPTADPMHITRDEWESFVHKIVSHPRSRKSVEARYSLAPEDFRAFLDMVD